jgi:methylsterol monooxygenase
MSFTNNYSTSFRWWDRAFGTDDKYRAYKRRLAQEKAARTKGVVSREEERKIEERLLEEVEREGKRSEARVEASAMRGSKTD